MCHPEGNEDHVLVLDKGENTGWGKYIKALIEFVFLTRNVLAKATLQEISYIC